MRNILTSIIILLLKVSLCGQVIERVEPPSWFVNMHHSEIQLMIYGENISHLKPKSKDVKITGIHQIKNPNYLFVDINLSEISQPQDILIQWYDDDKMITSTVYPIKARTKKDQQIETFDSRDVIYLITPDRFANGDRSNDVSSHMLETDINRKEDYARHGGDIQGIIDHLDYIDEMGFTALWINPLITNNQPKWSYHGYAITDFYSIDPRFGTNELYKELSLKAKQKGIGIVMDMVANHCGHKHWWMDDLPMEDWLNYQIGEPVITNHRKSTILDPYASNDDREQLVNGWFVPTMPDLNQRNPFLAKYLIQNSIWWIEYADLYGIRQDTYSYPDKDFMSNWTCSILDEYPNFNIVGEEWSLDPSIISYWQRGKSYDDGYISCLRSIMDFPLNNTLAKAFSEDENWGTGLVKLYENLGLDHHYANPNDILVFADNHDMDRIATTLESDPKLIKMALAYILTTRGIPQIYYGTEILMAHPGTSSHGAIRADFPGGWTNDTKNAFTGDGLNEIEKDFQEWLRQLLNWRKDQSLIHNGKLMHFAPKDGIYTFFRYNQKESLMVVFNKNDTEQDLDISRFEERFKGFSSRINALTKKELPKGNVIKLPPNSVQLIELKK